MCSFKRTCARLFAAVGTMLFNKRVRSASGSGAVALRRRVRSFAGRQPLSACNAKSMRPRSAGIPGVDRGIASILLALGAELVDRRTLFRHASTSAGSPGASCYPSISRRWRSRCCRSRIEVQRKGPDAFTRVRRSASLDGRGPDLAAEVPRAHDVAARVPGCPARRGADRRVGQPAMFERGTAGSPDRQRPRRSRDARRHDRALIDSPFS